MAKKPAARTARTARTVRSVLVTGGAGYVGSVLVPRLRATGRQVTVLDIGWFGLDHLPVDQKGLIVLKGDIRHQASVARAMEGMDAVIHLAAVSNDPSSDLDPQLTREVNLGATTTLVSAAQKAGVRRFVYASSSSVYGVKDDPQVTEDLPLSPLTVYSETKAESEKIVREFSTGDRGSVSVRSATVCGPSPRMRFDVVVNALTVTAVTQHRITVNGGPQKRPNIHMDDITRFYAECLDYPMAKLQGDAFNVGTENHTLDQLAGMVQEIVDPKIVIEHKPTNDPRSYHISSEKAAKLLGFRPKRTIRDAIADVKEAIAGGTFGATDQDRYYNVRHLKALGIGIGQRKT